jgi:peptidoglycan/LPS O-acetylase OafA/YrhL
MTEGKIARRIHGLDTLRTAAIILVLAYHYMVVVSGKNTFGFMTEIGWAGVDLFFVLSGYLIGNQILSQIAQGRKFSLKTFYIKRLLRTLPNYYVILALYFIFPLALGGSETASIWRFLSFTQNFGLHPGQTFTHSWSLCIEEQFYLVLPAIALLIASLKGSRRWGWIAIGAAVVGGMVVRGMAWFEHGQNAINNFDYYEHIYYSSFARFDELLPGVAIALLKNFHAITYSKIMRKGNVLFVAGLAAVGAVFYLFANFHEIKGYGYGFFMTTFGYPLLATSFAILTLAALSTNSVLHRVRVPGAASIALWSYAIYLAHKPIFKLAISPLAEMGIDTDSMLGIGIIMAASLIGGWLLFRLVETPFMDMRAKLYPADIATGQVAPNQAEARPEQREAA